MPENTPRMPKLEMRFPGGRAGVIVKMFDREGKKTYNPRTACLALVRFKGEVDPQRREIIAHVIPDYCPYTKATIH